MTGIDMGEDLSKSFLILGGEGAINMNEKSKDILITAAIFVLAIIFGGLYIEKSNHGYTESALLYLAGVMAAGLFWVGRKI